MTQSIHEALTERFPTQFGESYIYTSVGEGWRALVFDACASVEAALKPKERQRFRWCQIKEKFGRLRMYWETNGPLGERTRQRISDLVRVAEHRANNTCEVCGQRGRLYPDRYWKTLCDAHAAEEGRWFPAQYGVPEDCDATGYVIPCPPAGKAPSVNGNDGEPEGAEMVFESTSSLFLKDCEIRLFNWQGATGEKPFVFIDDIPDPLVHAWFDANPRHTLPRQPFEREIVSIFADGFVKFLRRAKNDGGALGELVRLYLAMPEGVTRDTRTYLEKVVMRYYPGVKVLNIFEGSSFGSFAIIEKKGARKLIDCAEFSPVDREVLLARIEKSLRDAARLKHMLDESQRQGELA